MNSIESNTQRNVMVIAGEVSGDMHAAKVIASLKQNRPDLHFWGIGGSNLAKTGMEINYGVEDMAVMGVTEVLRRLPFFKKVFNRIADMANIRKPVCAILVDYPGFNLRMAKRLRQLGICVIYYICPQVWAWNSGRIIKMSRILDHLITIFPFEPELFQGTGLPVDFVSHPLVDEAKKVLTSQNQDLPWAGQPHIALLPGSRTHEIKRILPVLKKTAVLLEKSFPDISFLIASPSEKATQLSRSIMLKGSLPPKKWDIKTGMTRQILKQSKAAIVTSGTATVEAGLMRCPMVVTYKAGFIEYSIAKRLINIPNIAMVNVIAGRRICPELIQAKAKPHILANSLTPLIQETSTRKIMMDELERVRELLGEGHTAEKAADIIAREIKKQEIYSGERP